MITGVRSVLCAVFSLAHFKVVFSLHFLFNILMHRLITSLPDIPETTITCHGGDTSANSGRQRISSGSFSVNSINCGIIFFFLYSTFPEILPHQSQVIRASLRPNSPVLPILPTVRALIGSVASMLRSLN